MSQENPGLRITRKAGADLSAAAQRYKAVKLDANGDVIAVAAATDEIIGVLQNSPKSGEFATIAPIASGGTCKARAGAAISMAAGNVYLKLDANGDFVTGGAGADENWAIALEAAGADQDIIEVLLISKLVT